MSNEKKIALRYERRKQRVRSKTRNALMPRVSVFRSARNIYAQLIDDAQQKTIVSCSTVELKGIKGSKKEIAQSIGKELAKRALSAGIERAILDRGPFLFHGRVAALAEGLKEGGLQI